MRIIRSIFLLVALLTVNASVASSINGNPKKVQSACTDMVYLKDGRSFQVTFLKETSMSLKYKKCDDPLNRTWTKEKKKVKKLVLADGTEKTYEDFQENKSQTDKGAQAIGIAAVAVIVGGLALGIGLVWWLLNELF